ncbi:uncharacterized protein LOC143203918 [Rhynchophorus ferrugineus]|uniref:uncharacterized protein LOC143203918 n=1 Tax=Rhynchophorus ferrugineus TaxID=354439 RepID=UPI003FCD7099
MSAMSDEDKTPTKKTSDHANEANTNDVPPPTEATEENRPHVSATTSGYAFLGLWRDERKPNLITMSQPNLRSDNEDLNVFKSTGGIVNSTSAMHHEHYVQKPDSKISLNRIPPSYSTVLKLGPPITIFDSRTYPSIPFIARPPPPSYAEVHGWDDNPSVVSCKFSPKLTPFY